MKEIEFTDRYQCMAASGQVATFWAGDRARVGVKTAPKERIISIGDATGALVSGAAFERSGAEVTVPGRRKSRGRLSRFGQIFNAMRP